VNDIERKEGPWIVVVAVMMMAFIAWALVGCDDPTRTSAEPQAPRAPATIVYWGVKHPACQKAPSTAAALSCARKHSQIW
jgi:hypothetical protein